MHQTKFILDTDIGPDCDDAAALALASIYSERYGYEMLGVMHCTSSPWGVGAIRAILNWYGRCGTEVGTLADSDLLTGVEYERYNKALALGVDENARNAPDCLPLYRKLLADQPDGSVDIIAIGPLRNLGKLITSDADTISPLTGRELVAKKVRRLTLMAGNFEPDCDSAEWNVLMDIPSARAVAQYWPSEMVYCGFEVGFPVITLTAPCRLSEANPVHRAYKLYTNGEGRMSWDLCTVQKALNPDCPLYSLSPKGQISIDERGVTRWTPDDNGRHYFMRLNAAPYEIARALESDLISQEAALT